jgi:hypothetical protein
MSWIAVGILAVTAMAAWGAPAGLMPARPRPGRPGPGGAAAEESLESRVAAAHTVLLAKLDSSRTMMQTMSIPPIYIVQITLSDPTALRGAVPGGLVFSYSTRDLSKIPPAGEKVIALITSSEKQLVISGILAADDKTQATVKDLIATPAGWKKTADGFVSPWAALKGAKWPVAAEKDVPVCKATGRPAALMPADVSFAVEQVPAANPQQWKNDYGDGSFKFTLTNSGKKDVVLPFLLSDEGKILWSKSLVVYVSGKLILPPDASDIPAAAKPVTIKAGETLSGNFNTLVLEGIEWPRGGSRVYFTFALADRTAQDFFYYFSDLHDPMRDAAKKAK